MPFRPDPARPKEHGTVWWRGEWRPVELRNGGRRLIAGGPLGSGGQNAGAKLADAHASGGSAEDGGRRASVDLKLRDGGVLATVPDTKETAVLPLSSAMPLAQSLGASNLDLGSLADGAVSVWQGTVDAVGDAADWYVDEQSRAWEEQQQRIKEEGLIGEFIRQNDPSPAIDAALGEGAADEMKAGAVGAVATGIAIGTSLIPVGSAPSQSTPPSEAKPEPKKDSSPLVLVAVGIAAALALS